MIGTLTLVHGVCEVKCTAVYIFCLSLLCMLCIPMWVSHMINQSINPVRARDLINQLAKKLVSLLAVS